MPVRRILPPLLAPNPGGQAFLAALQSECFSFYPMPPGARPFVRRGKTVCTSVQTNDASSLFQSDPTELGSFARMVNALDDLGLLPAQRAAILDRPLRSFDERPELLANKGPEGPVRESVRMLPESPPVPPSTDATKSWVGQQSEEAAEDHDGADDLPVRGAAIHGGGSGRTSMALHAIGGGRTSVGVRI